MHSSLAVEVRRRGAAVIDATIRGEPGVERMLCEMSSLPRSEARYLSEMVLTMCEAEAGKLAPKTVSRLHEVGVRSAYLFGLSFDDELLSTRLAPALIRLLKDPLTREEGETLLKPARYDRIFALALISPRLDSDVAFSALRASFLGARVGRTLDADLVIPIAGFESLFRESQFDWHGDSRERARILCLEAVRSRLESAVESLTEADPLTMDDVMRELPLAHAAGVAFLNLIPTIVASVDPEVASKTHDILYNIELITSRGDGYPGSFFHGAEVGVFDQLRSVLSLGTGVLALKDGRYSADIREMRVANRKGDHTLGTAVLHFARTKEVEVASELLTTLVAGELGMLRRLDTPPMTRMGAIELSALAWCFYPRQSILLHAALEKLREPRGQYYLTKAIAGEPWGG